LIRNVRTFPSILMEADLKQLLQVHKSMYVHTRILKFAEHLFFQEKFWLCLLHIYFNQNDLKTKFLNFYFKG
jgi:hypothetical protein